MNRNDRFEAVQAEAGKLSSDDDLFRDLLMDFGTWVVHEYPNLTDIHHQMMIVAFAMGYAARDQELAQDYALPDGK